MFLNPIELEFDGVRVKSPAVGGITRKPEKIWSKNTGRSASQQMQGTIKAIKYTYTFKWPPLSQYEKEVIERIVSDKDKPFHIIRIHIIQAVAIHHIVLPAEDYLQHAAVRFCREG